MKYYEKVHDKIILRDYLALDRTKLANERTLLAYIRLFIAVLAAGFGFIEFINQSLFILLGWIFVIFSPFILIIGFYRFITLTRNLYTIDIDSLDK